MDDEVKRGIWVFVKLGVVVLVLVLALTWLAQGNDFFLYRVFAPKYEQVRRQTFEQTRSYRNGTVQDLEKMQFDYIKADESGKKAMASIILHRATEAEQAGVELTPDLRDFVAKLRTQQSKPF